MRNKKPAKKRDLIFLIFILISLMSWPASAASLAGEIYLSENIDAVNADTTYGTFAKITPAGELKIKEQKIILLQGGEIEQVNNLKPLIKVLLDKDVNESTIWVKLTNLNNSNLLGSCNLLGYNNTNCTGYLKYNKSISGPAQTTFIYTVNTPLVEGISYRVTAQAYDLLGNTGDLINKSFRVVILPVNITLIEPAYGVTNSIQFNMTIGLDRDANCRYGYSPVPYSNMTTSFNKIGPNRQKAALSLITTPDTIYVSCNDSYGKIANASFIIDVDTSNPIITRLGANPPEVIQSPETTIYVETNETTLCRYSNDSEVAYSRMGKFPGYNEANFTRYHSQLVSTPTVSGTYHYYVQCEDKAPNYVGGSITYRADITYTTDFDRALGITVNGPHGFNSTSNVYLNISVNKNAACFYSTYSNLDTDITHRNSYTSNDVPLAPFTPTTKSLTGLNSSSYTYYIYCLTVLSSGNYNLSDSDKNSSLIAIDSSSPVMISVNDTSRDYPASINDSSKTWRTDQLYVAIKAQDNETDVVEYNYTIEDSYFANVVADSGILTSGITHQANNVYQWSDWITGLELNQTQYKVCVQAKNIVGRNSTRMCSDGITVNSSLAPVTCNDSKKDGNETDTDCGGSVCPKCGTGKNCSVDNDCISINCKNGTCKAPTCNDDIKNQDETDMDCGGSCSKCEIGDKCDKNSDCKSGQCNSSGECIELPDECANGKKDIQETDIDCGGDKCGPCDVGKKCDINSDCISGTKCIDNNCKACGQNDLDCDGKDNCEDDDIDGDGRKNWEDTDDDNDGLPDSTDQDDNGDGASDSNDKDCDDDFDNNGIKNCMDRDIDGDGIANEQDPDDDNDGLPDKTDTDDDNDGVEDSQEDCDNDGLPQEWEDEYCNGNCDPNIDLDGDGLINMDEYDSGTDPTSADTDGDGYSDNVEINKGTDPNNPEDYPKSNLLMILLIVFLIGLIIGGGFYGWKAYQKKQETKKHEPIKRIPPMQPGRPPAGGLARPQTPTPMMPMGRQLTPEQRRQMQEMIEKRRNAKVLERGKVFGAFGAAEKQEAAAGKPEAAKQAAQAAKREDVFARLSNLSSKKPTQETRKEAKAVFNQLSTMVKSDSTKHNEIKKGLSELKTSDEEIKGHITNLKKQIASLTALKSKPKAKKASSARSAPKIVIGSKSSNKYHLPNCIVARKMPKKAVITFPNEAAALKKGYKQCSVCFTGLKR